MQVKISFVVGIRSESDHQTDSRFSKEFDVDWPGRPMPGEMIELDIGHPLEEGSFEVCEIYWTTENGPWIQLKRIVLPRDWDGWEGELTAYGRYCKERNGWDVIGPAGRAPKPEN